jgi:hypothetical protein
MSTGSNETAAVVGAYESKKANKAAMNAQNQANAWQMVEQQRQYNQNRADLRPYTQAGYDSLAEIQALSGNAPTEKRLYSDEEKVKKAAIEKELAQYGIFGGLGGGTGKGADGKAERSQYLKAGFGEGADKKHEYGAKFASAGGDFIGASIGKKLSYKKKGGDNNLALYAMYAQQKSDELRSRLSKLGRDYTPEEIAQQKRASQDAAFSKFRTDPGYQFQLKQGVGALDQSAASRGGLFSGRQMKALDEYGTGMADQSYGNYYNRLWNTANMGRGTAVGVADMGTNYANSMSGLAGQRGNIASNRAYGDANATSQMASTIGANQQEGFNTAVNTASSIYGMGR